MTEISTATLRAAVPGPVHTLARVLAQAGFRSWAVGGCVRDELLTTLFPERGAPSKNDWDLATDARPEQVQRLFRRVIPTGIQHGTVTVLLQGQSYEVTTLRGEVGYSDGRRPDAVFFVDDLTEDLARRDFTVNAIAYDVLADSLHDPFDGVGDLRRRLLRAVGDPARRFAEDGLRVLRCARLAATLELDIEEETRAAIRPSLASFRQVSIERVRDEWFKAFKARRPSRAFEVMRDEGLLEVTAPELARLAEHPAPDVSGDVLTLSFRVMDALPRDPVLRFAGLVHATERGTPTLATRLRLSNAERDRVAALVRQVPVTSEQLSAEGGALRRWLRDVSLEHLESVLELERARLDAAGLEGSPAFEHFTAFARRARAAAATSPPLAIRDLAITGKDLMNDLGLPPGPALGRVLAALLEVVLDDPAQNHREALLVHARSLAPNASP